MSFNFYFYYCACCFDDGKDVVVDKSTQKFLDDQAAKKAKNDVQLYIHVHLW